ncbi:hypothetical protein G9A89_008341 [Geosiphon pyriformis]|nr:hypothetical protein G9A89_008341 [Geosiphon pyriformis]
MRKAYDSVGWEHLRKSLVRIKMCNKFIQFFGSIHNDRVNRVMTDFGLTDGYWVHDGLDQGEVFFPLLWRIFYDPLLCEVKRQESVCGYRLDSHFVTNTSCAESRAGLISFLAAGAFVNDTIWVGSSQAATQHIFNVANLSKPSLAKACLDVQFFTNLVLRKAISDKQFSYLVSAVLYPIIAYRTQFSFVPISRTFKWWKRLDPWGPIPDWFNAAVCFLSGSGSSPVCSLLPLYVDLSDVLESCEFDVVCNRLLEIGSNRFSLFTDGSLYELGTFDMKAGAAVFFEDIDLGLGVEVSGLVSSTMTELGHSGVLGNERVDTLARAAASSGVHLLHRIDEHFLKAGGTVVSGNSRHFVRGVFCSIYRAHWKVGSGSRVLVDSLCANVDWFRSCSVWHPDSYLAAGFTSAHTAGSQTYFMKALHHRLSVAVRK